MPAPLNVLIVGGGAVGQTYAAHLQQGGARVSLYVRPAQQQHAGQQQPPERVRYRWSWPWPRDPPTFRAMQVFSDLGGLVDYGATAPPWDQIWLCVPSTALRGQWLEDLLAATEHSADTQGPTIVSMAPGLDDQDYLHNLVGAARCAFGMIPFLAYDPNKLRNSAAPPSTVYWLPPLMACTFSGASVPCRQAVRTLRGGGLAARVVSDAARTAAFASAIMMPIIAALELSGWSIEGLRRGRLRLNSGLRAAREAGDIVARYHSARRPPWWSRVLTWRWSIIAALIVAPRLTPIPLQAYLRLHFSKVGNQTMSMLGTYVARGRAQKSPVDSLHQLMQQLLAAREGKA